MGYHRAGFEVVGIDIKPQPHYPFPFLQGDVLDLRFDHTPGSASRFGGLRIDAIHASPPCQFYANLANQEAHRRLIPEVRAGLIASGLPYVIENIADAKWDMRDPVQVCGSSFGLNVRRHRLFETSFPVMVSPCNHAAQDEIRAYYGKKGWLVWSPGGAQVQKKGRKPLLRGSVEQAPADMGIDWMTWDELREAIPPAYTQFLGEQLMQHLGQSHSTSELEARNG